MMMMKKLTVKKPALKKFAAGGAVAKKKPVKKYADGGMLPVGSVAGPSTPQPDPTMLAMQQQMASDKAMASGKKAPPAPAPAPSPEYQRITNMLNADAAGAQARAAFQQRQKAFGTPAPRRRMAKGGVVAKMSTVKGKKK